MQLFSIHNKFIFCIERWCFYYNARVCILNFEKCRLNIMNDFYNISKINHPGFEKTCMTFKRHYYWLEMKKDVKYYVDKCLKYQVFNTSKKHGLL